MFVKNHRFTYNEKIKVESVTQAVCDLALRFGESAHGEESIMVSLFEINYVFRAKSIRLLKNYYYHFSFF